MRFFRKSRWKFTVLLPKEIHLDEDFIGKWLYKTRFFVSLRKFVVRNTRFKREMEKNTHSNLFVVQCEQFIRLCKTRFQGMCEINVKCDITYDEYEQKVIWKLKENASEVFKIRLSNILSRHLGFNMSLPLTKSPMLAKVDRHWEKMARAESNHRNTI